MIFMDWILRDVISIKYLHFISSLYSSNLKGVPSIINKLKDPVGFKKSAFICKSCGGLSSFRRTTNGLIVEKAFKKNSIYRKILKGFSLYKRFLSDSFSTESL